MKFRPMKPYKISEADLDKLSYPVVAQPKYDGIRCVIYRNRALSYSLKPIRNHHIRTTLESEFAGINWPLIDGELMLVDYNATFQQIQSAVNRYDGGPQFRYIIFDCAQTTSQTLLGASFLSRSYLFDSRVLPHTENATNIICYNKQDVLLHEQTVLAWGYEGIILRGIHAPYKFGRSTLREQALLALKRFEDAEAEIVGAYPLERNYNEAEANAHGLTERSSAQSGKFTVPLLGGFIVRGINGTFKDVIFNVGSGFTNKQRKDYWHMHLRGSIIKYKYQSIGAKDKPRMPIFLGFRSTLDM